MNWNLILHEAWVYIYTAGGFGFTWYLFSHYSDSVDSRPVAAYGIATGFVGFVFFMALGHFAETKHPVEHSIAVAAVVALVVFFAMRAGAERAKKEELYREQIARLTAASLG